MSKLVKITEDVRSAALRRPLKPDVIPDADTSGLALRVTRRRSFWSISYSPHGTNPNTGKRWGSTRHELGDAQIMTVKEARAAALAAKALVMEGHDPHREKLALRASRTAERSILPTTVAESLDAYERALMARQRPTGWTRKQYIRNARSACAAMNAAGISIIAVTTPMVRLMVETMSGSDAQRWQVYHALERFLGWCRKQGLIKHNPCDDLDRQDRPRPGRARSHVPSINTLRSILLAVSDESEPARSLMEFMEFMPLRRNEASGLRWSEVDFDQGRIRIAAHRMKARRAHELPMSEPVRTLLERRRLATRGDLVFPTGVNTAYRDWARLLARIRRRIGEGDNAKDDRFSLHDFRRSFVSHLAGAFDVDTLDQVLGHVRRGVLGTYQHSQRWPDRVRALDHWAALITRTEPDSNVVSFARGAHG